jgi:hypothetical protein
MSEESHLGRKAIETVNQPDPTRDAARRLFGIPVFVISQISITRDVRHQVHTSYIIVADMSQMIVGLRTQNCALRPILVCEHGPDSGDHDIARGV